MFSIFSCNKFHAFVVIVFLVHGLVGNDVVSNRNEQDNVQSLADVKLHHDYQNNQLHCQNIHKLSVHDLGQDVSLLQKCKLRVAEIVTDLKKRKDISSLSQQVEIVHDTFTFSIKKILNKIRSCDEDLDVEELIFLTSLIAADRLKIKKWIEDNEFSGVQISRSAVAGCGDVDDDGDEDEGSSWGDIGIEVTEDEDDSIEEYDTEDEAVSADIAIECDEDFVVDDSTVSDYERDEEEVIIEDDDDDYDDEEEEREREVARLKYVQEKQARLQKESEEKAIDQARVIFIAQHGYTYQLPVNINKEIQDARLASKKALEAYHNCYIDFWGKLYAQVQSAVEKEKELQNNSARLKREWEIGIERTIQVKIQAEKEAKQKLEKEHEERVRVAAKQEADRQVELEKIRILQEAQVKIQVEKLAVQKDNFQKIIQARQEKENIKAIIQAKFEEQKSINLEKLERLDKEKIVEHKTGLEKAAWGDNVGLIGKQICIQIGLRESELDRIARIVQEQETERMKSFQEKTLREIENVHISCAEIRAMIAAAIARGDTTWQYADIPIDCRECSEKKEAYIKNDATFFNQNNIDGIFRRNLGERGGQGPVRFDIQVNPQSVQGVSLEPFINFLQTIFGKDDKTKAEKAAKVEADKKVQEDDYKNKISLMPRGGAFPFQPTGGENGEKLTNKYGDPLDNKGNAWKLDQNKKEWKVYTSSGKLLHRTPIRVDRAQEIEKPEESTENVTVSSQLQNEVVFPNNVPEQQVNDLSLQKNKSKIKKLNVPQEIAPKKDDFESVLDRFVDERDFDRQQDFNAIKTEVHEQKSLQQIQDDRKNLRRAQVLEEQEKWKNSRDLRHVDQQQLAMIDDIHARLVDAKNDIEVEFAQGSLQAWQDAQDVQSFEAYDAHIKKAEKLYGQLQRYTSEGSLSEQKQQIKKEHIDALLSACKTNLHDYQQQYAESLGQRHDRLDVQDYQQRLENRAKALEISQEQLRTGRLEYHSYEMSHHARGYMMAHNLNYAAFDGGMVTQFQHCLTQEILGVIESSVDLTERHGACSVLGQLARYNCQLAVSAQQLNKRAHLDEAVAVTDLTHFFELYGRVMLDDVIDPHVEIEAWKAIGQGAGKALYRWKEFACNLVHEPKQTMATLAKTYLDLAQGLYTIAEKASATGLFDSDQMMKDNIADAVDFLRNQKDFSETKFAQRVEHGVNMVDHVVQAGQTVVESMLQKSPQENMTDISEFCFDTYLAGKIPQVIGNMCQIVGDKALQAGMAMQDMLPPSSMNSPLLFATEAGDIIATIEATGENIGTLATSKAASDRIIKLAENALRTKELADKLNSLVQPDPEKVAAFQKSIEPYLNSEKLIDVKRLQSIEGVEQINKFKDYTKNFHPDEIAKLQPEEILYLNLCDWLEREASSINDRISKLGLKITEVRNGITCVTEIKEFDIFHSLLGEMRPGSVADATSGGHLFISELKAAIFKVDKIENFKGNYFDLYVKHARGNSLTFKPKTCFPAGYSIDECVNIIIDVIQNHTSKIVSTTNKGKQIFDLANNRDLKFRIYVEFGKLRFSPLSSHA